jgi:copper homeostasis protein CutC
MRCAACARLRAWWRAAQGRIAIVPGGGITADNIAAVARGHRRDRVPFQRRTAFESPVRFRKRGMAMGDLRDREYRRFVVREESVRALAGALPPFATHGIAAV